jgi:hypothetical protein
VKDFILKTLTRARYSSQWQKRPEIAYRQYGLEIDGSQQSNSISDYSLNTGGRGLLIPVSQLFSQLAKHGMD